MTQASPPLIAVLIDADNTSPKYAEAIFEEIASLGEAAVRRVYGDFSSHQMKGWNKVQAELGLVPHHQPANTLHTSHQPLSLSTAWLAGLAASLLRWKSMMDLSWSCCSASCLCSARATSSSRLRSSRLTSVRPPDLPGSSGPINLD